MYAIHTRTPSPSPPSSPSLGFTDSSPPSSPTISPISLHDPLEPLTLSHPLAASVNATRCPRLYEKKVPALPSTSSSTTSTKKSRYHAINHDICLHQPHSPVDPERDIWVETIATVIDTNNGTVELNDQNLTYIPREISELAHFVGIPLPEHAKNNPKPIEQTIERTFRRVMTSPASRHSISTQSSFSRTLSNIRDPVNGLPREELRIFLARNQIRTLPVELFRLKRLTVLSIRGNKITYLPPEIKHLTNLRELNVSNNQLSYLPSEILEMHFRQLWIHPNPFLPELPPLTQEALHAQSSSQEVTNIAETDVIPARLAHHRTVTHSLRHGERTVSKTTATFPGILSLTELCLRVLISPSVTSPSSEPTLTSLYVHPISPDPPPDGYGISEPLRDILNACVPGSISEPNVPKRRTTRERLSTGVGVCSAPRHRSGLKGNGMFVSHAEERYTWEETVGGIKVGERVCCRWRGCEPGCLDYLGDVDNDEGDGSVETDLGEDEKEVVQLVSFGGGLHF